MSNKIGLGSVGNTHQMEIVQWGRFYYPIAIRDGAACGIFSTRSRFQKRFTKHADAVNFAAFWFNWYSHPDDKPRYYLAPDTSEQDYLIQRADPFKHSKAGN